MDYIFVQWLLIFYIYCFLGWVWEFNFVGITSFIKTETANWENRGFLYSPILPIYGSGAIIILWLTLPLQDNILLIFILGSLGATALEYMVGFVMEKLFQMRLWDYSNHKFNINGYINLPYSIGWGLISLLLIKLLHPIIDEFIISVPLILAETTSLSITIIFVMDITISTLHVLDFKKLDLNLAPNRNKQLLSSVNILRRKPTFISDYFEYVFKQLNALSKKK